MDGVHYLKEINNQDISELYVFPQIDNKINVDIDAIFDRTVNEFFTYQPYTIDGLNIYLNGQALFGGGYQLTGDIYHQQLVLDFDYLLTGNYVFSNGFIDGQDNLVFDAISGVRRYRNIPQDYNTQSGVPFLRSFDTNRCGLYLNGVKLVSGYDYALTGVDVKIINPVLNNISGLMFVLPEDSDFNIKYTGQFNFLSTQRFARNTSMLWGNGDRQNLDEQYLEVSNVGLLTGSRNFDQGTNFIFNNDTIFWR